MRLSILLFVIVCFAFIYIACNRNTIQKSAANRNKILTGWSHSTTPLEGASLSFDAALNVTKEETDHEVSYYQFAHDSVTIKEFSKEENRYVFEFAGKLDSNKRLIRGTATSSYISSMPDTVHHSFEYNREGYLLRETRLSASSDTFLIKYEYEDELLKKILTYSNSELYNTKEFTYYYYDLGCNLPQEFKFRKNLNNLVGRSDQKPVKNVSSTGRDGKQKYLINYTYQVDESGYAFKMIGKKGKKIIEVVTFLYGSGANASTTAIALTK